MSVRLLVSFVEISEVGLERLIILNKTPSPSLLFFNKKKVYFFQGLQITKVHLVFKIAIIDESMHGQSFLFE